MTYHWSITCSRCGRNWLRIPISRLRCVLWRIPLNTSEKHKNPSKFRSKFHALLLTHLTCAEALLLIVKFSARDARELSKSPVNTLLGCCWIAAVPVIGCCIPPTPPVPPTGRAAALWAAPDDVDIPPGFRTSPKASKPYFHFCMSTLIGGRRSRMIFCLIDYPECRRISWWRVVVRIIVVRGFGL